MSKYKAVPVEPTPEMVDAAADAYMPFGDMDIAIRMAILAAPDTGMVVLASDYDTLAAERDALRTALAATDKLASEAAQRNEDMGRVLIKCREWVYPPDKDCKCDSCAEAVALLSAIDAALSRQVKP